MGELREYAEMGTNSTKEICTFWTNECVESDGLREGWEEKRIFLAAGCTGPHNDKHRYITKVVR